MFDMINIFEVFLPQLLRYPNPTDPLNGEAAALLMRDPKMYEQKVKGVHIISFLYSVSTNDVIQTMLRDMPRKMLRTRTMKMMRMRMR